MPDDKSEMYLIKSITRSVGDLVVWWGPGDRGYTCWVALAGRYTRAEIEANREKYDNGERSIAVPESEVIAASTPVVPVRGGPQNEAAIIGAVIHEPEIELWEQSKD